MNLFQSIYCNQYAELKRNGRDATKARKNGIILIAAMLVLDVFLFVMLINTFAKDSAAGKSLIKFFEQFGSGRNTGKLLGALLFFLIIGLVYITIGKQNYFDKTITKFEDLDEARQKRIEQNATIYVFANIGLLFILLMVSLFASR